MKKMISVFTPLIVVLVLFFILVKVGVAKALEIKSKVDQEIKNEAILTQKLSTLQEVSESENEALVASAALPGRNPLLIALTQIKSLAISNGLILASVKANTPMEQKGNVFGIDINFEMKGGRTEILNFLTSFNSIAPISRVIKFKLGESGGITNASVVVRSYYAPLPQKLPALTEAINKLTANEQKLLSQISTLSQPFFIEIPPSGQAAREDPFNP